MHSGEDKGNVVQLPEGVTPSVHITQNEIVERKYRVEEVPLDDSGEDEFFPVISGTTGGNENTKICNDGEQSNSTCRNTNTGSGSILKKDSQRIPKQKSQFYSRKESEQVNDEQVSKFEGIKNEATSKLNSVYDEIRPTIVMHGRDNQDSVPTSVAEKWIEANCSKYKADLDFYFSVIKNVMCSLPATDASTAAGPSEGGTGSQTANVEVKPSD